MLLESHVGMNFVSKVQSYKSDVLQSVKKCSKSADYH